MMRADDDDDLRTPAFERAAVAVAVAGLIAFTEVFARRMAERLFPERKEGDK